MIDPSPLILAAGPPPDAGGDMGSLIKLGIVLLFTLMGAILTKRQERKGKAQLPQQSAPPPTASRPRITEREAPAKAPPAPPIARPTSARRSIPEVGTLREDVDRTLEQLRRRAPTQRAPARSQPAPATSSMAPAPPAPVPRPVPPAVVEPAVAQRVRGLLHKPTDLRAAFVLAEILAPPLALRE